MALTTMVYDGVFERFPRLRVATIESARKALHKCFGSGINS